MPGFTGQNSGSDISIWTGYCNNPGLDRLTEVDFSNSENSEIFLVIVKAVTQDELDPSEYILENIENPQKESLQKRLESYNPDKINEDDLISDLLRTVIRIRQNRIKDNLRQLRFLQEEQQEQDQTDQQKDGHDDTSFQDMVITYTQDLNKLNRAILINTQTKLK